MEKCGYFLSWSGAETIKEAEKEIGISAWKYAKDIEVCEVTMEQIADKFGTTVNSLKIVNYDDKW